MKFLKLGFFLCIISFAVSQHIATTISSDLPRLISLLESFLNSEDLQTLYYATSGLSLLKHKISNSKKLCSNIASKVNGDEISSIYYGSGIVTALKDCKLPVDKYKNVVLQSEKSGSKLQDMFMGISAAKSLGIKLNNQNILKVLSEQLKAEDTLLSQVYAVQIGQMLGKTSMSDELFSLVEDIMGQADEIDGKFLQLEGGIGVTGLFLDGAFKLADIVGKSPKFLQLQLSKMTNYIVSRKDGLTAKNVYFVILAAEALSTNSFQVPVAVTLHSSPLMTPSNPRVVIEVATLLGKPVKLENVIADQVARKEDMAVIVNKQPFVLTKESNVLYELDILKVTPEAGYYKVLITLNQKSDAKSALVYVGLTNIKLDIKVMTNVVVEDAVIAVIDSDVTSISGKTKPIATSTKFSSKLSADFHQKIVFSFSLKDKTSKKDFEAHQAFVRLLHQESNQEIFFIAEREGSVYKFDLNVGGSEKIFRSVSGLYSMDLIIGDAVIDNPFMWNFADVSLTFAEEAYPSKANVYDEHFEPRPEIKHTFRVPEKRPSTVVSSIFTGLIFVPFAILLIVWIKLGANFGNLPFSVDMIGFHGGLFAIFTLYTLFWLKLNMFTTLKCLAVIGVVTFLFGHRLLKFVANNRSFMIRLNTKKTD